MAVSHELVLFLPLFEQCVGVHGDSNQAALATIPAGAWDPLQHPTDRRVFGSQLSAVGGTRDMRRGKSRAERASCVHENAISISSAGMTRSICSDCGYISFEAAAEMTAPVTREMFAREVDLVSTS